MDILTQLRAERGKVTRPFKCRAPRFSPERLGPRLSVPVGENRADREPLEISR